MELLTITLIVFLVVGMAVFGLYYAATAAKESPRSVVKRRLRALALGQPSDEVMPSILKDDILSEIPAFNRVLFRIAIARKAEKLLDQADSKIKVGTLFLSTAVLFAVGLLAGLFLHRGFPLALLVAAGLAVIPYAILANKKNARLKKFTSQFPDALDMISRSLRAGHSFTSAMQVVYQEMPDPVSKLFHMAYDEQNLGLSLSESLENMTRRINSLDLSFFVTTVNIQRETGGNLAEIFEKLGTTIRERFRILGQLKVYTAQGRLSGYILAAMPVVMVFVLWVINPDYLTVLIRTRIGIYMVISAVVFQIIGLFVIRKIINIQI